MGARYYQANAGSFTQLDPRGSSVIEANRFAYTGCNPVNAIDPSGLEPCSAAKKNLVAAAGFEVLTLGTFIATGVTAAAVTPVAPPIGPFILATAVAVFTTIQLGGAVESYEDACL